MTEIPEPSVGDFFVSDSEVYILVTGIKNAKEETFTEIHHGKEVRRTRKIGETHQYIARFSTDGSYKGAVSLDFPFRVIQIAAFDSGSFLIAGVDNNKVPRVAELDSSGQLQNYIKLDKDITDRQKATETAFKKTFGLDASADIIAMYAQFRPYHGNILLVRIHTDTPIYEIRDGGEARAVKVKAPEGFALERMVPSDGNDWLIEFASSGSIAKGERVLYEVSAENGQLLRQYRVTDPDLKLACRCQDDFVAFREIKNSTEKHESLKVLRGLVVTATESPEKEEARQ